MSAIAARKARLAAQHSAANQDAGPLSDPPTESPRIQGRSLQIKRQDASSHSSGHTKRVRTEETAALGLCPSSELVVSNAEQRYMTTPLESMQEINKKDSPNPDASTDPSRSQKEGFAARSSFIPCFQSPRNAFLRTRRQEATEGKEANQEVLCCLSPNEVS